MKTRREALKIIGAVGATCSFPFSANELYGQHIHQPDLDSEKQKGHDVPFEPRFFTQTQFELVSRVADLIIPPTDTPGAIGAGVPKYIDLVVKDDSKLQAVFRKGFRRLEASCQSKFGIHFMQLTEAQQIEILKSFSEAADRKGTRKQSKNSQEGMFFQTIKNLTADGYYTSRVGLLQELGYNGNTVLSVFPEFTIAEH